MATVRRDDEKMKGGSPETAPGVNRRRFIAIGGSSGAAALAAGLAPHASAQETPRRHTEIEETEIAELQSRMERGDETARSLVEKYLARIEDLDRQGPMLRSLIETNPAAIEIAESLDEERRRTGKRSALHGIPILLKDNIDTGDRMLTTAGSRALVGKPAPRDSFVAQKLREAGAILLGKANLSEWANFRSTESSSGWSGRGGQCRNPYALDRNPSGSSSGSAVAAAASLTAASVGTETDGSIVSPASKNGLVGIKPTVGLVSRAGIVPISASQDTAGPMARSVRDAAILLAGMAGRDPSDSVTHDAPEGPVDYTRFLTGERLDGLRIGVPRERLSGYSPHSDRVASAAFEELARLGAEIVDPADIPHLEDLSDPEWLVLLYEFKAGIAAYLAERGATASYRTLAQLIRFNEANREQELPYFGQEIFERAEEKGSLESTEYKEAIEKCRRLSRSEGIDRVMDDLKLDALVAASGPPAWLIDLVGGDCSSGGASQAPAVSGYPHITLPAGQVFGLPLGLSIFGRAWSEGTLLRIAYAYEQATHHRKPPTFAATVDLRA